MIPQVLQTWGRSTGLHRQHMKLLQSGTADLNISSKHCRAYLFTQALQCCSIHQAAIPVVYPGNAAISILVFNQKDLILQQNR